VGGLITWIIGCGFFIATGKVGIFGLGYHDLSDALNNNYLWWAAGIAVAAKLIATVASYGFGGCGGIFSPLLFIGGMCGYFISGLLNLWIPVAAPETTILVAVGMCSCLGAVVKAPLTSMLIVFEMTHQFELIPGLLIGTFASMAVSKGMCSHNLYDSLLIQDGNDINTINPPKDLSGWQNLPVSYVANTKPFILKDMSDETLVQALKSCTFNCFPILLENGGIGIISRASASQAVKENTIPVISAAVCCHPDQTLKEAGELLIGSDSSILPVISRQTGEIIGVLTIHDILRAQASVSE
jgi:CIC family chloride channel protein